jgi:hypothetical protein
MIKLDFDTENVLAEETGSLVFFHRQMAVVEF